MNLLSLERIGDWNPQLFRELKGRLKLRKVAIALAMSLLGQVLLFASILTDTPSQPYSSTGRYCSVRDTYLEYDNQALQLSTEIYRLLHPVTPAAPPIPQEANKLKNTAKIRDLENQIKKLNKLRNQNCPLDAINMQLWWQDKWPQIFVWLSLYEAFILLVGGTFMLVSDLTREERLGSLNFIRLSPQSSGSIFLGKILGVPILLYLAAAAAIPFHLWAGLAANISLVEIFGFWAVAIASCAFFYSAALLFGLVTSWLSGFQPWLAAVSVLVFLLSVNNKYFEYNSADWLNLFCPSVVLPFLVDTSSSDVSFPFSHGGISYLEWFYFPLGNSRVSVTICALLNFGFWTYWIWQSLNRRFRSDRATMLGKRQSYLLAACFAIANIGFAMQTLPLEKSAGIFYSHTVMLGFNGLLFLLLIAALSPHRQVLQDWARYKEGSRKGLSFWAASLRDLVWGEKSPSLVAIALNVAITSLPTLACIWVSAENPEQRTDALSALALTATYALVCAALIQFMLLMKTPKRALWAAAGTSAAICLLPFILSALYVKPAENGGGFWLLTAFPSDAIKYATATQIFQVLLIQWSVFGLLTWQFTKQLRIAGESASKALLSERK